MSSNFVMYSKKRNNQLCLLAKPLRSLDVDMWICTGTSSSGPLRTSSPDRRSSSNRSHPIKQFRETVVMEALACRNDSSRFSFCSWTFGTLQTATGHDWRISACHRSFLGHGQERLQSVETPEWRTTKASAAFATRGGISEVTEASPSRPPQSS